MPQPAATAASAHGGRRRATAAHRKAGSHAHKEWHKARRHPRATCSWRAAGTVLCCRETGQRGRREPKEPKVTTTNGLWRSRSLRRGALPVYRHSHRYFTVAQCLFPVLCTIVPATQHQLEFQPLKKLHQLVHYLRSALPQAAVALFITAGRPGDQKKRADR